MRLTLALTFVVVMVDWCAAVCGAQQPPRAQTPPGANQVQQRQAPHAVAAPFHLTDAHQQFIDQVLLQWEEQSGKIKTYKCDFEHFQYLIAIAGKDVPMHKNRGEMKYAKPASGSFHVHTVTEFNGNRQAPQWVEKKDAVGEHYVCDGKKVYVYNHRAKQLEVTPIPPELQGKRIVDGPLPFLFGAEAAKMKHRYWIRATDSNADQVWLDVRPKFAADAANYRQVEVILDRNKFLPQAIKVYRPNGDEDVYVFDQASASINGTLDQLFGNFVSPKKPFGWKVVENKPPTQPQQLPRQTQRTLPQSRQPARY